MAIGELVRQERERRALSKSDLARLSGLTPPVITRIEAGENVPKIATVVAIARALGIEPGYFLAAMAPDQASAIGNVVAGSTVESVADYLRMAQRIISDALQRVEQIEQKKTIIDDKADASGRRESLVALAV